MSTKMIVQELADLKQRVARLEADKKTSDSQKSLGDWKEAFGAMKDCELFEEAMQLGAEWRAKANREGR